MVVKENPRMAGPRGGFDVIGTGLLARPLPQDPVNSGAGASVHKTCGV